MTILEVLEYPHPKLREPCQELTAETLASQEVQGFISDMVETMYACNGAVGLAAPQVGQSLQILVMDASAKTTKDLLKVMINPQIISQSKWKFAREGCLSFPDYLVTVKRARKIECQWTSPDGQSHIEQLKEFEAIILQHELDHLNGILFIDRLQNPQRDMIRRSQLDAQQTSQSPSE